MTDNIAPATVEAFWSLAFVVIFIGALLVGAFVVERLLPPRVDREFSNLSRNARGRRAQARDAVR